MLSLVLIASEIRCRAVGILAGRILKLPGECLPCLRLLHVSGLWFLYSVLAVLLESTFCGRFIWLRIFLSFKQCLSEEDEMTVQSTAFCFNQWDHWCSIRFDG
jgi:hypothetical protein